jgi:hypothetical protein
MPSFSRNAARSNPPCHTLPEAASALKAKGLSSSQVFAINIADGVLTEPMIVPPKALATAHQVMPEPSATAINDTVNLFKQSLPPLRLVRARQIELRSRKRSRPHRLESVLNHVPSYQYSLALCDAQAFHTSGTQADAGVGLAPTHMCSSYPH